MASDEASTPSETADQIDVMRNCDKCGAEMKPLGVLAALSIRTAISVLRCYACDHVVAYPI